MFPPSQNVWPVRDPGDDTVTTYPQSPIIPNNARKIKNKTVRRRGHWGALGTSVRRVTPPRLLARSPKGTRDWRPQLRGQSFPFPVPKGEEENRGRETGRASRPREGRKPRSLALWGRPRACGGPERGPRRPWLFGSLPSAITPPAFLGCYLRTPAVSGRREREVWSTRLHCDVVIDRRALGPLRQPLA